VRNHDTAGRHDRSANAVACFVSLAVLLPLQ
jgi:hypothetical protein